MEALVLNGVVRSLKLDMRRRSFLGTGEICGMPSEKQNLGMIVTTTAVARINYHWPLKVPSVEASDDERGLEVYWVQVPDAAKSSDCSLQQ